MKRKRVDEFDFALDKSIPIVNYEEDLIIYNPTILLNDIPNEIVSAILDYILEIKDGFAFISTCSAFRDVLNDHELFIEFRLDRELNLLIKREESNVMFRGNRNRIDSFGTKISNLLRVIGVKQIRDSKLEDWRKFVNQYREPYRKCIWKYLLNRISYHSPTFIPSAINSITNETKDCQFYIDNVLIKCCEISYSSHSLMVFNNDECFELVDQYNKPNYESVKKLKEIIGISESKIGRKICKLFSTSTLLNTLIISLPNSFHFIGLLDEVVDSSSDEEEESDQEYTVNLNDEYDQEDEYNIE